MKCKVWTEIHRNTSLKQKRFMPICNRKKKDKCKGNLESQYKNGRKSSVCLPIEKKHKKNWQQRSTLVPEDGEVPGVPAAAAGVDGLAAAAASVTSICVATSNFEQN